MPLLVYLGEVFAMKEWEDIPPVRAVLQDGSEGRIVGIGFYDGELLFDDGTELRVILREDVAEIFEEDKWKAKIYGLCS